MRLVLAVVLAASPLEAATTARTVRAVAIGGPRVAPALTLKPGTLALPTPVLTAPTLTPALNAAPAPVLAPQEALAAKLAPLAEQAGVMSAELARLPGGESSVSRGAQQFSLLTGEQLPPVEPPSADPQPEAPQDPKKTVRLMRYGTAFNKFGAEAVKLGVPILALQTMGSATSVAILAVTYGLAQALMSSWAGTLTDRFPASKVLAGAIAVQIGLAAVLFFFHTPVMMFALYGLIGAAVGVAETTRRVVPPLVLGQNPEALKQYNGSLHLYYEAAGVAGAIGAGLLMTVVGPLYAMLIQPPAFLISAFLFSKVKHRFERKAIKAKASAFLHDFAAGARLVLKTPALRWVAAAMILPQVVHRVFEDLMLPVFAKGVLHAPTQSAFLLAASNAGEFIGAIALLKLAERRPPWVKWSALGLLSAWALTLSSSLPLLLPVILLFSATWASADLHLLSELQARLSEKDLPRVLPVLLSTAIVLGIGTSLLLGRFLDATSIGYAFVWVNAAFTALAALVYVAYRKLSR